MKKIILFYLLSCLSILLIWFAIDDYDIESKDYQFGFNVMMLVTCAVYAPICTLSACILYYTKVNKSILLNKVISIIYCILPFLCFKALNMLRAYTNIEIGNIIEYSIPIVFVIQNIIIVLRNCIKNRGLN